MKGDSLWRRPSSVTGTGFEVSAICTLLSSPESLPVPMLGPFRRHLGQLDHGA